MTYYIATGRNLKEAAEGINGDNSLVLEVYTLVGAAGETTGRITTHKARDGN
jgi:hypothetical protein